MSLCYALPTMTIEISDSVLEILDKHRQRWGISTEAGGQLFCTFEEGEIQIKDATEPRRTDRRSRFSFLPNRAREQQDIERLFSRGLHYIGDWHTHPEDSPLPSQEDISKIKAIFAKSNHELKCMVLMIAGRVSGHDGLWVGVVGDGGISRATAVQRDQAE